VPLGIKTTNQQEPCLKGEIIMNGTESNLVMEWPYPVDYGKENEAGADVLVVGGGIAGC